VTTHRFREELKFSHGAADEPEWCAAYRKVWPDLAEIIDMRHPGVHQKQGVDRVVILANGKVMTIDEKVRREHWDDVLVEIWSVYERRVPGWTIDPGKKCSHIAYLTLPTRTCILIPYDELRRATIANRSEWERKAGPIPAEPRRSYGTDGFCWIPGRNEGWITWSIGVPREVIQRAILAAMVVTWHPLSANRGDGTA
jgi:hypothetical protein